MEQFKYPKLATGLLREVATSEIKSRGWKILFGTKVVSIDKNADAKLKALFVKDTLIKS